MSAGLSEAKHRLELAKKTLSLEAMLQPSNPIGHWTGVIDIGKFAARLVKASDNLAPNLCELPALKLASQLMSTKYAEGHKLLCGTFAAEMDELQEVTVECAAEYERVHEELLSSAVPSGKEWPPDLRQIDFRAIEELAVCKSDEILQTIKFYAKAQLLIPLDQGSDALEALKLKLK